ncbi:hypothetical protein OHB26_00300 [Nocardia sp. NBC_01503]|uniref:hypothetical protein n=1 Tax=Nocardia sp. NBC_01503 TaxID=2975997 RepID=UPI002E7B5B2F|nr:hypothetical protein [Nocardia sp. NBC_01503]WTL32756.1 hypothetical protein OHB26_00300 [Nocardia sp. NBC_01503]
MSLVLISLAIVVLLSGCVAQLLQPAWDPPEDRLTVADIQARLARERAASTGCRS